MNIFKIRKFIFTNLFLFNLINFLYPLQSSVLYGKSKEGDNLTKSYFSEFSVLKQFSEYEKFKDFLEVTKEITLERNLNKESQLNIQSDKQYQQDSVLYAEGNVIANYKGNTLKADFLVYDKSKEIVEAEGDVFLALGDQVFRAEKINFDFKKNQGSFTKVKGLIKTKNLLENLDFTSYDSNNVPKVVQKIKKARVLNTPDGVNNWIFYTDELKVKNDKWFASKAIFTNDLLESDQINFVINNLKIIPRNDSLEIKTSINFLVWK